MADDFKRRIGVGERQHTFGRHVGRTNTTVVVGDDGPRRGQPVGTQTEHWSGRLDATVCAPTVHASIPRKASS